MSSTAPQDPYRPISEYALIGNCHTAALVSLHGSIDWYCPRRFDAPAVFCRLLDARRGGYFRISPGEPCTTTREYQAGTAILKTLHIGTGFAIRVTDFMPIRERVPSAEGQDVATTHQLLRLVEGMSGECMVDVRFRTSFDFGTAPSEYTMAEFGWSSSGGNTELDLACPVMQNTKSDVDGVDGQLCVRSGDRHWFILSDHDAGHPSIAALAADECDRLLNHTLRYWEQWSDVCTYQGPYRDQVVRSALTLKLLTYEPSGAVVAAPTTSLPEEIGGGRNWDYRFCWLRDSAMILYSLMTVGYEQEAGDYLRWLSRTCGTDPMKLPQIMYTIDGGANLPEYSLELEGYRKSGPVRVGNGAAHQVQLDIYGEVLIAAAIHFRQTDETKQNRELLNNLWPFLSRLVNLACLHWQDADAGIWEVRGGAQQFLFSKLMCWVAVDRGLWLSREYGLDAPTDNWVETRQAIRDAIMRRGYDGERGVFTQAFENSNLDAIALRLPVVGFLPPTDPKILSTIKHIQAELTHKRLVYRYRSEDGIEGSEGTFTLCSFWLVDALALSGQVDEARDLFEHLLEFTNDVGLMSEEIDPDTGLFLGNFPQGFSHLALIESAVNLSKASKFGPERKPENLADRAEPARQAAEQGHG